MIDALSVFDFANRKVALRATAPLNLSISVSDVADAFYEDFATWEEGRYWWWIQMILLDPNELIVNDGYDDLYRMAYSVTDNGPGNEPSVEFGDLVPVRLEPVDSTISEDEEIAASVKSELVAAAVAGISSVRGRDKIAASYTSREESRPNAKKEDEQVREHLKRLRAKLGLGDDVSDEQVLAAAAARLEAEPDADPDADPAPDPAPAPAPAPGDDPQPSEDPAPAEEGPQMARVSTEALASLQADATAGREARTAQLTAEDERFVDAAISCGKIPSRSRASSLARMGRSVEARAEERAFIDELDENVIPVELRGGAGSTESQTTQTGGHPALHAWASIHMPDAVERREQVAARRASGQRDRVLTDA